MGVSVLRLFVAVEECLHLRHDDLVRDAGSGVGERLLDLGAEPCVIGFRRGDRPRRRIVGVVAKHGQRISRGSKNEKDSQHVRDHAMEEGSDFALTCVLLDSGRGAVRSFGCLGVITQLTQLGG